MLLVAATVAALGPFVGKAFCIDDPLFLWAAEQIQSHPLDFYGTRVHWYFVTLPLSEVTKNPPLASYLLAGGAALFGWSETALHSVFLLPAIGAVLGAWRLAIRFCKHPAIAALLTLATPAFLVSSTNVMCDTLMLCLWTWSLLCWIKGLERHGWGYFLLSAVLIATASLAKYFAMSLLPLIVVYTLIRRRRPARELLWLLLPIAVLTVYQWWTWYLYGRGLLSDASEYTFTVSTTIAGPIPIMEVIAGKALVILSFTGGSFAPILLAAPFLCSWRKAIAGAIGAAAFACGAMALAALNNAQAIGFDPTFRWTSAGQLGLFCVGSLLFLSLVAGDLFRRPSADNWLLALWIGGTFVFAGAMNWTCNVRSLLPMAPAVAIVLVRRLENLPGASGRIWNWCWIVVPSAALALATTWADFRIANANREGAFRLAEMLEPEKRTVWFEGHWGFQYYMRRLGGREIEWRSIPFQPGDLLVIPFNNSNLRYPTDNAAERMYRLEIPSCGWCATINGNIGAGYYASVFGPVPFLFGSIPPEYFGIWRIIAWENK